MQTQFQFIVYIYKKKISKILIPYYQILNIKNINSLLSNPSFIYCIYFYNNVAYNIAHHLLNYFF